LADFVGRQEMGELAIGPRISQGLGGIAAGEAFALGEFVEGSQRG
jgi:hypothetical protein